MPNEADTCRKYVVPKLQAAGWDTEPHAIAEQRTFTDGRIIVAGGKVRRGEQKRADYLLRYRRDFSIAVVEAKASYKTPGTGMGQAKDYAQVLGLRFAYSTNGHGIVEFDFTTGLERELVSFPTPEELWRRLRAEQPIAAEAEAKLLEPLRPAPEKPPRYYQELAVNRTVQAILQGQKRVLLTMATGTGKTDVAFHICWKLWSSRWNRTGEHRKPKILYLSDRNFLVDDPKDKTFATFGDARCKIGDGELTFGRQMYFAIYQAVAGSEGRPGRYREFRPDFFDLIVVDECHRGSAREDSTWREILEYFEPAYQLGMTATPLRDETRDTYRYFGNPIYTYSLRQGIEDGFLAPYRVHRVVTDVDAAGWRPTKGELDRYGREIPDGEYTTKDFERVIALKARTEAIAKHLADFMARTNRYAKTIVFCVDQEHADEMRRFLNNLNADLVQQHPDYVCRVTADEGDIGLGHMGHFQDVETVSPVILTTSQLLSTGLDAPTCQNVVLARVVGSMTEFKQILGRGTRVKDEYGKLYFNLIDYTGSATSHFADPDFDGYPASVTEVEINEQGEETAVTEVQPEEELPDDTLGRDGEGDGLVIMGDSAEPHSRKFYVDDGAVVVSTHLVYELDEAGRQLRVVKLTDYAADQARTLYSTAAELRRHWADPLERSEIIRRLGERGIDFEELAETTGQTDADPFDLLCHVAYNAPLRTRRERAERLRKEHQDFFDRYGPEARAILDDLLEKYAEHGVAQFAIPDILKVPPISTHGNVIEIATRFGGTERLREAVAELQTLLYAA